MKNIIFSDYRNYHIVPILVGVIYVKNYGNNIEEKEIVYFRWIDFVLTDDRHMVVKKGNSVYIHAGVMIIIVIGIFVKNDYED